MSNLFGDVVSPKMALYFTYLGLFFAAVYALRIIAWVYNVFLKPGSDLSKFKGEWALVTGGAAGIGRQFCVQLAERGVCVCVVDVDEKGMQETVKECTSLGVKACSGVVDFAASPEQIHTQLTNTLKKNQITDKISILVNNVGGGSPHYRQLFVDRVQKEGAGKVTEKSTDNFEWLKAHEIPLDVLIGNATFQIVPTTVTTHIVLPSMVARKKGLILFMSSMSALSGMPLNREYAAGKSYLRLWAHSLAGEVNKDGVQVQAIYPGFIRTNLIQNLNLSFSVTARGFVSWALHRSMQGSLSNPHPVHQIVELLGSLVPMDVSRDTAEKEVLNIVRASMKVAREEYRKVAKQE